MPPPLPSEVDRRHQRVLRARFQLIGNGIYAKLPRQPVRSQDARDNRPARHAENEHNRIDYNFKELGETAEARFRANRILAEEALAVWRAKLAKTFPDRQFVLFVSNELMEYLECRGEEEVPIGWEIVPILRLWTVDSNSPDDLSTAWQPGRLGPDMVFDSEAYQNGMDSVRLLNEVLPMLRLGAAAGLSGGRKIVWF